MLEGKLYAELDKVLASVVAFINQNTKHKDTASFTRVQKKDSKTVAEKTRDMRKW